ncbi:hypothetical protein LXL04_003737 [Taraxacum kok-saghyz]
MYHLRKGERRNEHVKKRKSGGSLGNKIKRKVTKKKSVDNNKISKGVKPYGEYFLCSIDVKKKDNS